jgi:hypothetical protein
MTHSTETAQRRLLEALAELRNVTGRSIGQQADPLGSLLVGIQSGIEVAEAMDEPGIVRVYLALSDLVTSVRNDFAEGTNHG